MNQLPIRIMHMVKELHQRGYSSLYLYSGLSPSGMHWRYEIGQMIADQWPVKSPWVKSSVQSTGATIWAEDNSTVTLLADGFESHYQNRLTLNPKPTAYSHWYADILDVLATEEPLVFFEDYGGRHKHLLASAPGYSQ